MLLTITNLGVNIERPGFSPLYKVKTSFDFIPLTLFGLFFSWNMFFWASRRSTLCYRLANVKKCLWKKRSRTAGPARFPCSDISSLETMNNWWWRTDCWKLSICLIPFCLRWARQTSSMFRLVWTEKWLGLLKLCTGQTLIAGNQVSSTQTVVWPMSPWWRLSLNVIM